MIHTLQAIASALRESQTRAVLIGGLAVNQYGVSRQTFDIDLVIHDTDEPRLLVPLRAAGFVTLHRTDNFHRLRPADQNGFVVDFLFLEANTFDQVWTLGEDVALAGCVFRVASPEHLIRMKLHAMRFGRADRVDKDMGDVLQLMRRSGWTPGDARFKEACLKHGTAELYDLVEQRWNLNQI